MKSGFFHFPHFREIKFLPVLALFFFLGFGAYFRVLAYPFVHDDVVFIQQNPHSTADWARMFQPREPSAAVTNPYWRPGLEIFYFIQYQLFGLNPQGYHLTNILLHILNSSLVFYYLKMILGRPGMALAVALVFLLHPVQSEAVACVSGISNIQYVLFCLLSLVLYQRRTGWALVFFGLALLSKEQAIVLPLLIFLDEYGLKSQRERNGFLRFGVKISGFIGLAMMYLLLRKIFLGSSLVSLWAYPQELFLRLWAIPRTLLMYSQILLWPQGLHYYRSIDILVPWQAAAAVFLMGVSGLIVLIGSIFRSIRRPFLFGLGWFMATLLPTLNILPLIHEYSYIAAFEHFLYLPLAGFFLCVFLMFESLLIRTLKSKDAYRAVGALLVGILSFSYLGLTFLQTKYWREEIPLFERVLKYEPGLGRVHFLLGQAYYFHKDYDRAISEWTTAASIMRGYMTKGRDPGAQAFYRGLLKDLYFNLAHGFEAKGQWDAAIGEYARVLELDPRSAEIYNNIGNVYVQMGELSLARESFTKAVEIDPGYLMALSNLAVCYIRENNLTEAERLLRRALEVDGQFAPAKQNLEQLLLEKKQRQIL